MTKNKAIKYILNGSKFFNEVEEPIHFNRKSERLSEWVAGPIVIALALFMWAMFFIGMGWVE